MDNAFHKAHVLQAQFEQTRLDLIRTDLDTCLAFADLAETEYNMGNREHAGRTLASAEKGYSDMFRFFTQAEAKGISVEVAEELRSKFKQLRDRLESLAGATKQQ